ncbi:hypothetical protein [uncultured Cyclobacterium sp.]|uniref:hypothetical protein n=1 Tax=uncultured Cyclobacterium sp. TaxID=453820 RepID=UPI0030EDD7A7
MPFTNLLKEILHLESVSGDEANISAFILNHILERKDNWKVAPKIYFGEEFQDNIVLVFGAPRTAVFAHMDTVGFTARYENQLVPIGGPEVSDGVWPGPLGVGLRKLMEICIMISREKSKQELYFPLNSMSRWKTVIWKVPF